MQIQRVRLPKASLSLPVSNRGFQLEQGSIGGFLLGRLLLEGYYWEVTIGKVSIRKLSIRRVWESSTRRLLLESFYLKVSTKGFLQEDFYKKIAASDFLRQVVPLAFQLFRFNSFLRSSSFTERLSELFCTRSSTSFLFQFPHPSVVILLRTP